MHIIEIRSVLYFWNSQHCRTSSNSGGATDTPLQYVSVSCLISCDLERLWRNVDTKSIHVDFFHNLYCTNNINVQFHMDGSIGNRFIVTVETKLPNIWNFHKLEQKSILMLWIKCLVIEEFSQCMLTIQICQYWNNNNKKN